MAKSSMECSLIIETGCRFQVFSLILDSSVGLSAGIQSAADLVSETMGSNPAFSRGRQLVQGTKPVFKQWKIKENHNTKRKFIHVCLLIW